MKKIMTICLVLVILSGASVTATPIVELNPFSGYTGINVSGINDSGAAVGYCTNTSGGVESFIWTQAGGMQSLGTGVYARGINNNGQIVGENGSGNSVYWSNSSTAAQIITPAGSNGGIAYEINDAGLVAGRSGYTAANPRQGYVWNSNTNTITLVSGINEFYCINKNGVAVGLAPSGQNHLGIYDSTTGVKSSAGTVSTSYATVRVINDLGLVAGNESPGAFVQTPGGVATTVTPLSGYTAGQVTFMGINNAGQLVGDLGYGQKAFIWEDGAMMDLNGVLGNADWNLKYANDINANGWIVGTGTYNGASVGYVLVPEPATMMLLGLGGVMSLISRKRKTA